MFLFIRDSLGSTELFFILLMALVFFGPRKLPQLSRSLGKNLAEFRKASEDFKRTWEREVAFEEANMDARKSQYNDDNSILNSDTQSSANEKMIEAVPVAEAVERQAPAKSIEPSESAEAQGISNEKIQPEPTRKQDWL